MQDGRVKHMENWLINKKLNEAYQITQLRDDNVHDETVQNDLTSYKRSNPKGFKQWMTQKSMQERYEQMDRAR